MQKNCVPEKNYFFSALRHISPPPPTAIKAQWPAKRVLQGRQDGGQGPDCVQMLAAPPDGT